jgi:hypothetical protein
MKIFKIKVGSRATPAWHNTPVNFSKEKCYTAIHPNRFILCLVHTENLIRIKRKLMRIKFDPRSHREFDAH